MKVLLRDPENGLYYRGLFDWTAERLEARNLLRSEAAARLASNLRLQKAEVVLSFGPLEEVVVRL